LANFVVRETRDITEDVARQPPPPPPPRPRREVDADFTARNEASIPGDAEDEDTGLDYDFGSVIMVKYIKAIQTRLEEEIAKGNTGCQAQWRIHSS